MGIIARQAGCLRLLTWNIQQGGGKRWPRIAEYIRRQGADVVVLTEFHPASGHDLRVRLAMMGLVYQVAAAPSGNDNTILVASTTRLERVEGSLPLQDLLPETCARLQRRWLNLRLPAWSLPDTSSNGHATVPLSLGGVHAPAADGPIPIAEKPRLQREADCFWQALRLVLQRRLDTPYVLIGDLNTGLALDQHIAGISDSAAFFGAPYITALRDEGWLDAWRHLHGERQEYTWRHGRSGGWRLDGAWLSPALHDTLIAARHRHAARRPYLAPDRGIIRTQRLSDHSALVVDIQVACLDDVAVPFPTTLF